MMCLTSPTSYEKSIDGVRFYISFQFFSHIFCEFETPQDTTINQLIGAAMGDGCVNNTSQFVWYMPIISLLLPTHKDGPSNQSVPGHVKLTISNNQSKYFPYRKQLLMRSSIKYCNSIGLHKLCVENPTLSKFWISLHPCLCIPTA